MGWGWEWLNGAKQVQTDCGGVHGLAGDGVQGKSLDVRMHVGLVVGRGGVGVVPYSYAHPGIDEWAFFVLLMLPGSWEDLRGR